jgi:hypothetical protein
VKLKLTDKFPKFFMEMRRASVVCTSRHRVHVHASIPIAIPVSAIEAPTRCHPGGGLF